MYTDLNDCVSFVDKVMIVAMAICFLIFVPLRFILARVLYHGYLEQKQDAGQGHHHQHQHNQALISDEHENLNAAAPGAQQTTAHYYQPNDVNGSTTEAGNTMA